MTEQPKLRAEIERVSRGFRNTGLTFVAAFLAAALFIQGYDYARGKWAERRADLIRRGLRPTTEFYEPASEYTPLKDLTNILPASAVQNSIETKVQENSCSTSNIVPSADNLDDIPEMYEAESQTNSPASSPVETQKNSRETNPITNDFIERLVQRESSYKTDAVSKKGARGLMQIMEPTWYEITEKLYGKKIDYCFAFDSEINKEVGVAYLRELDCILTNSFPDYEKMTAKEKQKYLAAAYNGGITRLIKNKGEIKQMPKETRNYVKNLANI